MDNLFGKDDSGNDSDHVDVDIKDEQSASFEDKQSTSFEDKQSTSFEDKQFQQKDPHDRLDPDTSPSLIQTESDTASNRSSSDQDKTTTSSPEIAKDRDNVIDIVKHEMEIEDSDEVENTNADSLFDNVIVLPHSTPMAVKDRRESKEKSKRELEEEEREKMQVLVSNFTEDQLDRYEMYRRAAFPKAAIKRIMQTITGCSVSQNVVIAMSGIAKVFVGEIVEEALDVMEANNETGPLQPKHLREAVRRLRLQGQIPTGRAHKAFFRL